MTIKGLNPNNDYLPLEQQQNNVASQNIGKANFSDTLGELVNDVNNMQIDAADNTDKLIRGEPVDIHDVMISAQKAKTSFELLMELRNKGLDLYREVLRIQV